jgi:hypothetical protein
MELIINLLASLIILLSPQVSEAPSNFVEVGIELGADGCPIEEPCWDYEAEDISEMYEAFGYNVEEEALTILENLPVTHLDPHSTVLYEYVASYNGGTPEFDPGFFTVASSTHPGVEHVFQAIIARNA